MSNESRLINAVHNITRVLSSTLNLDEGLRLTLQVAMEAVSAEGGTIWMHEQGQLICRHVVGEKADELRGFALRDNLGIAGRVFREGIAEIDNDIVHNPDFSKEVDMRFHHTTRNLVTTPLRYPGGEIVGVVQLINKREAGFTEEDLRVLDIVASVAAMSLQRVDLEKQARKGALMDFLGRIAHDVKNLDSQISGPLPELERLLNDALAMLNQEISKARAEEIQTEIQEWLGYVKQGAQRIHRYTDFMAKVAHDEQPRLFKEKGDLVEVVEQALGSLEPKARQYKIRLNREFQPVPVFEFDPLLIERAVINLVDNALPHVMAGGTVTVRTRYTEGMAAIEVEDTGAGIFPHVLRSILDGTATSNTPGGTGLGNQIVKEAAEKHGGVFDGISRIGRGTTFFIRLPCAPA